MASNRQLIANRRNAQKSTGPRTAAGKLRSRRNALKHGLSAETVVTVFEDTKNYEAFERLMIRDHAPESAIEHQLVVRLTSLLWRLRRATAIETGLFSIQAQILRERKSELALQQKAGKTTAIRRLENFGIVSSSAVGPATNASELEASPARFSQNKQNTVVMLARSKTMNPASKMPAGMHPELLAQCFLRVSRLDDKILERINRYEVTLWRQAAQILDKLRGIQGRVISRTKNVERR